MSPHPVTTPLVVFTHDLLDYQCQHVFVLVLKHQCPHVNKAVNINLVRKRLQKIVLDLLECSASDCINHNLEVSILFYYVN